MFLLLFLPGCLGDLPSRESLLAQLDAYLQSQDVAPLTDTADGDAAEDAGDSVADAGDGGSDVAGETDAATDAVGSDADADAGETSDVALTCSTVPAAPGCACKDHGKCASGVCLTTPDNIKLCATPCVKGQICGDSDMICGAYDVSPTSQAEVCVPKWQTLCDPCLSSATCGHVGSPNAQCVNFGASGAFCGVPCADVSDCPKPTDSTTYACQIVTTIEGKATQQCVPTSSSGGLGECTCSNLALIKELSTDCYVPNVDGSGKLIGKCASNGNGGKAIRKCEVDALTACDAYKPKPEVCDGVDNDCNGEIDEGACDDGKVCTSDFCVGPAECTHTTHDGNACDDGNPCTTGDICDQSTCVGSAKVCPGAACIATNCDVKDGVCQSALKPDTASCDDGNSCTVGDICLAGNCSGGGVNCDDANPCTNDSCDPKIGCVHDANTALCNDNSACTDFDECLGGSCIGKTTISGCDDGNPCTNDTCDNSSGCVHLPGSGTCTDGNPCTIGDLCSGGLCVAGVNECACSQDADCKAKEDGNFCNGTLFCDTSSVPFQCQIKAGSVVTCTAPNSMCQTVACNPSDGACITSSVADGTTCNFDGSVCTVGDACVDGNCTAGPTKNCDDGNLCTDDSCDASIGCVKSPNSAACSDGDACTSADMCQSGGCVSGPVTVCDPGSNVCVTSVCDSSDGLCKPQNVSGPCDDKNLCTTGDMCVSGACTSGVTTVCTSSSQCVTGSCDLASGNCAFKPVLCDDGNPCTIDSCSASSGCVFSAKSCDDGNACTTDSCDAKTGACVQTGIGCDDNNFCTADSCNTSSGCVFTSVSDGTVCSVQSQICVGGKCMTPFALPTSAGAGISGGSFHTCVRSWAGPNGLSGGGISCWGSNQFGQLGSGGSTGTGQKSGVPVSVLKVSGAADVDCGSLFSLAMSGSPLGGRSWGANNNGQLGSGGGSLSSTPVDVSTASTSPASVKSISAGGNFACAIYSTKKVWCWGDNGHLQLGQGLAVGTGGSNVPVQVSGLSGVTAISAGSAHACAVSGGNVYCWGQNKDGQCGQVGGVDISTPFQVSGLSGVTSLAAGDDFTCALAGANVSCWGSNKRGQLATGSFDNGGPGVVSIGISGVSDITAGLNHACARQSSGSLACWGANDQGQLGIGSQTDSSSVATIPGISNAYRIGAGDKHTCSVRMDGSVWCWGNNVGSALGLNNGSDKPVLSPAQVYGTAPK